jgi:hypothetical protein
VQKKPDLVLVSRNLGKERKEKPLTNEIPGFLSALGGKKHKPI